MRQIFFVLVLGLSISCGQNGEDGDEKTKMTLKIKSTDSAIALAGGESNFIKQLPGSPAGNLSFTPSSYKLWISTIALQNDSGLSNQFYICDSSEADCEVDFADATSIAAFEARLSNLEIQSGTYTKVWLSCTPASGGYLKIKGAVTFASGAKIYTADTAANAGIPFTDDNTKNGTLKINFTGGSCGITMPLAKPLEVASSGGSESTEDKEKVGGGATVTMTMFSNLLKSAYYVKNGSSGMGGCVIEPGSNTGKGFCATYPSVFPYFGETKPTVEYYRVANAVNSSVVLAETDVNVMVKVILDEAAKPFWASFNQIFTETTPGYADGDKGVSGYTNSVSKFAINADNSLTMKSQDYGFSNFARSNHNGEVLGEGILNGGGTGTAVTYYYRAFRYTP